MIGEPTMEMRKFAAIPIMLLVTLMLRGQQSTKTTEPPRLIEHNGRHALMVDGAPYLILGMQVNNSSAWPALLPQAWAAAEQLHVNTVEAPIYWEQFEPRPGQFDDGSLSALLKGARANHLRLVLLWFGTWKNGSGHYTPEWMKRDNQLYPRVVGKDGRNVDSLSPLGTPTLQADRRAFVMLMRHLRALDPQHTVILVQVENETGTWGSVRDFSPAAEAVFSAAVPARLLKALHRQPGTWRQVFGQDADEFFHAWCIASYVEQVAAAGKAENPLPLYVNVALRDPIHPGPASSYESGGPTDNVIDIWKVAAPSLDLIAPDIYMPEYAKVEKAMGFYGRSDNALFIPEIGNASGYAHYLYMALGAHAIGFSPFGMDNSEGHVTDATWAPFAAVFGPTEPMQRELALWNFEGRLQAVAEDPMVHDRNLTFEGWQATVSFGRPSFGFGDSSPGNPQPIGGACVAQLGPDEFVVSALHARVDFRPLAAAKQRQFIRVEEGRFENGVWHTTRVLNGDQTDYGLNFEANRLSMKVTLATY